MTSGLPTPCNVEVVGFEAKMMGRGRHRLAWAINNNAAPRGGMLLAVIWLRGQDLNL